MHIIIQCYAAVPGVGVQLKRRAILRNNYNNTQSINTQSIAERARNSTYNVIRNRRNMLIVNGLYLEDHNTHVCRTALWVVSRRHAQRQQQQQANMWDADGRIASGNYFVPLLAVIGECVILKENNCRPIASDWLCVLVNFANRLLIRFQFSAPCSVERKYCTCVLSCSRIKKKTSRLLRHEGRWFTDISGKI